MGLLLLLLLLLLWALSTLHAAERGTWAEFTVPHLCSRVIIMRLPVENLLSPLIVEDLSLLYFRCPQPFRFRPVHHCGKIEF